MNPQPDPPHGEQAGVNAESRARLLADTSHEREVVRNMLFTTVMGLIAIVTAVFTTVLELTVFWRNLWLAICVTFAVLMFAGIFQFCTHIDTSTSPETKH